MDPEVIKILNLVALWNFGKGQGSPKLISDYGAHRAIRPRCIETVKAQTQYKSIYLGCLGIDRRIRLK